jgi:NAD(P)-dependent dehydrogenase (short-subunit alcohol dehydrogenase family)
MNIDNAIALVTGANRSIGVALTRGTLRTASARAVPEAPQDFSGFVINVGENQQYSSRLFRCSI